MFSFLKNLFDNDFMPHGHCFFWKTEILWLHVISDIAIALSYYFIPCILIFTARKRKNVPFKWVLTLFSIFILLCGTTHLVSIWVLWDPIYRFEGLIKLLTAIISVVTALMMLPLGSSVLNLLDKVDEASKNTSSKGSSSD